MQITSKLNRKNRPSFKSKYQRTLKRDTVPVWLSDNGVAHIKEVTLRRTALAPRWVTVLRYTMLAFNQLLQLKAYIVPKILTKLAKGHWKKKEFEKGEGDRGKEQWKGR